MKLNKRTTEELFEFASGCVAAGLLLGFVAALCVWLSRVN